MFATGVLRRANAALSVALVIGPLAVLTTIVAGGSSSATLPSLPGLALSSRHPIAGRVPAVRHDVVERILGRGDLERLLAVTGSSDPATTPAPTPTIEIAARTEGTRSVDAGGPASRGQDARDESHRGRLASARAPGDWHTESSMGSDRATAERGDQITYTIRIRNVGSAPYVGDVAITSHVPLGTTAYRPAKCEQPWVDAATHTCGRASVPVPGTPPTTDLHEIQSQAINITIHPGDAWTYSFNVVVDAATPSGAVLRTHAHVQAGDSAPQHTDVVEVTVQ